MRTGTPIVKEPTLIVVANEYERRYYYSASQAGGGMGYVTFNDHVKKYGGVPGEVHVYRLDIEATDALIRAIHAEKDALDKTKNVTSKTWNARMAKVVERISGVKPKTHRRPPKP